jgi:glycosyltransferase involved in cell wall biosynthesis
MVCGEKIVEDGKGKIVIDILMATYNGQNFIDDQIRSILAQSYQNFRILIRDDGSQDNTVDIIQRYLAQHPDKINLIKDSDLNLGAKSNFSRLLSHAESNYVLFCDQDDVWLPHKIRITFDRMKNLEDRYGEHTPLLVHTDAKVVDRNLNVISRSLWSYQKNDPKKGGTLTRLLLQNVVTGCTVMINNALRDMTVPIPSEAVMHDWWLALVASAFGRISAVSEPTLLYRQHERNDMGAKGWNVIAAACQLSDLLSPQNMLDKKRRSVDRLQKQAEFFLNRYHAILSDKDKRMIASFSHLSEQSYLKRRYSMIKFGFFYTNVLRNMGMFFFR